MIAGQYLNRSAQTVPRRAPAVLLARGSELRLRRDRII